MQVEAFLADTVQGAGGKLSALGIGWSVVSAGRLPTRHDRVGIGVTVRLGNGEVGTRRLELRLLDPEGEERPLGRGPEGNEIRALSFPLEVPGAGERTATFALNLDGLVFDREGGYAFVLGIDGLEAKRLPFRVQIPRAAPAEYRAGTYL